MKIVCSSSMPYAYEAFSTLGDTIILEDRSMARGTPSISAEDVRDASILAVRSGVKVNRELLQGSKVKFVGTATIGFDHFDTKYLESAGIHWCYAPGSNANSVSEYVTSALLCIAQRCGCSLSGKTIGVIGVGNVGSIVVKKAQALGMKVLPNDPPKERMRNAECGMRNDAEEYVALDRVLDEADIITLHVPLTKEGRDATYHVANSGFLEKMKRGAVFINSSRGAVADTPALLAAMKKGIVAHAVIDTWENEPDISRELLDHVKIGTPHIAGYSLEGKIRGTEMVYNEACRFLGVKPAWSPSYPPPTAPELDVDASGRDEESVLWEIVRGVYDIETDDGRLRSAGSDKSMAVHFRGLRRDYPVRREFRFTRVNLRNSAPELAGKVQGMGFAVFPAPE